MKLVGLLLLVILFSCSQLPSKRTDKLSILQGITNTKEVEFSIVAEKSRALTFELRDEDGTVITPAETKKIEKSFSDYAVYKAVFERDPQKTYNLFVYQGNRIVDQRLVGRGQKENSRLRLAVISCMNDFYTDKFKIWDALASRNPEYLIMIGDNVYADVSSLTTTQAVDPEVLWNRYVDVRMRLPYYFQDKLIPTHALWDDHDYGAKGAGEFYQHKEASREVFEAFFAQDLSSDDWTKSYGVGGLLSLGDFNLYFLDARFYRSPEKEGSHLGVEQTEWFYSKLREEGNPSLIIKGDQFFGGYHQFDSFEGNHPKNFLDFISELKKISTPYVFISGDRHMSEIMQFPRSLFGKPSFEITSSPMHARTYEQKDVNPWRVVAQTEKSNFTIIDNEAIDNHWFMDVENIGENNETFYKRELAVFIKDLQDNLKETRKRRSGQRRYRKVRPSRPIRR